MTVINRALHKAYKRRAESEPARELKRPSSATDTGSASESKTPTVSGWASKLREPIRPLSRPTVSIEAALATVAPAIMPHALPEGAIIRVDAAHMPIDSSSDSANESPSIKAQSITEPALPAVENHSDVPRQAEPAVQVESVAQSESTVNPEPALPPDHAVPTELPGQSELSAQWSWPPIVQRLLTCPAAKDLRDLAVQLRELAAGNDLRCVAFSGPGRNAGRTSLVLTLASVLIADKTTRVAIVDADFSHPHAAQLISLHPAEGLEEAIANLAVDDQVVTTLIENRLAIVPLAKPLAAESIDNRRIGTLQTFMRSLRRQFDLVLIDAGPWETANLPLVLECRAVDAVVCVCRTNATHEETAGAANFLQPGVEWLGTIETFAPPKEKVHVNEPPKERLRQTA